MSWAVGRPQLHSDDAILDAARAVVLQLGARATTIDAIVTASGAPKGSIYHRFGSHEDLLAAMWIRAVRRSQAAFIAALERPDPVGSAVAGALSLLEFAQRHPGDARVLVSLRREDILQRVGSPQLCQQLAELNRPLEAALTALARRLYGRATRENVERVACAVVDLPLGAMRRHLIADARLPGTLSGQLEAAVRASLQPTKGAPMSDKGEVVRRLFQAVEQRDMQAVLDCYDDEVEIHEAESLPYGGVYRGHAGALTHAAAWLAAWGPLQTSDEYRLEASFLEGEGDTVGAVFRHRAVDREHGTRLDNPEVAIYEVRDGKVVRSQMFHADSAAVVRFLEGAQRS